jgi:tetratricopeptide (TPR) repeat protein
LQAPPAERLFLKQAQSLLAQGKASQARAMALIALRTAPADARLCDFIGGVLSRAGDQRNAHAAYDRAVALAPEEPHFRFNRATVRRFLGDLTGAEADYDRVIALRPHEYEAYLNRSELRPQTPSRNHAQTMDQILMGGVADWRGEVALRHALAKEYEDLGQYERSFSHLARGARLRREHLRYDVDKDIATVDWIIQSHSAKALEPRAAPPLPRPIFIVGLPRSGSTLVERILGCQSAVQSGGELPHFALALTDAIKRSAGRGQLTRQELIARSTDVNFDALGDDYLARVRASGIDSHCFTDKMPLNYLYCGIIWRAVPGARIIHARRHPLATCYSIYKTLFKDGYPFSYDLGELGRYYVGYRRLMDHWSEVCPAAILDFCYEDLISDPRGQIRRLLDFCGLDWEEACAQFQSSASPTTTASAAQVRRPLYESSVNQWRNYATHLVTLAGELRSAGILDE